MIGSLERPEAVVSGRYTEAGELLIVGRTGQPTSRQATCWLPSSSRRLRASAASSDRFGSFRCQHRGPDPSRADDCGRGRWRPSTPGWSAPSPAQVPPSPPPPQRRRHRGPLGPLPIMVGQNLIPVVGGDRAAEVVTFGDRQQRLGDVAAEQLCYRRPTGTIWSGVRRTRPP